MTGGRSGSALAPTLAALAAALVGPGPALAHAGEPLAPHDLPAAWTLEPAVLAALAVAGGLYGRGAAALWRRSGRPRRAAVPRLWQAGCYAAGALALAAALVSPLDRLAETLFAAHMAQHVLLVVVAAPLLVLGGPLAPLLWGLPDGGRRRVGRWLAGSQGSALAGAWRVLAHPLAAWSLHAAALWLWHVPALYEAALVSAPLHAVEHASFTGTALLYWWTVLPVHGRARRWGGAAVAGVLSVFATAMHSGALGALITFARDPWYPSHAAGAARWGLSPLEDQQVAGAIMWVVAGTLYAVVAVLLTGGWLAAAERDATRAEARRRRDTGAPDAEEPDAEERPQAAVSAS